MIECTITDITVDSQYQDTVYTQTVTANLDGVIVHLFDGASPVTTDDLIGKTVDVQLIAQARSIDRADDTEPGIEKRTDDDYTLVGVIDDAEQTAVEEYPPILVDVGVGKLSVEVTPAIEEQLVEQSIKPADTVIVTAYRLDLVEVSIPNGR